MIPPCWFHRGQFRAHTIYNWPNQGKPTLQDWDIWDAALRLHVSKELPLGQWTLPEQDYIDKWEWFLDNQTLYRRKEIGWERYAKYRGGPRTQWYILTSGERCEKPQQSSLQRTFVYTQGQHLVATGCRCLRTQIQVAQNETTWQNILRNHPHSQWICQWLSYVPPIQDCCRFLYDGEAIGVSDGSYSPENDLCSAAWIIKFNETLTLKGGGIV